MKQKALPLTVGVEEELFLVDQSTRELVSLPDELVEAFSAARPGQIAREFLASQAEIISKPCNTLDELREDLQALRTTVSQLGARFNLQPIAASIHPFASWQDQDVTDLERYHRLADYLQVVVRRMLIGGMHIHVGLPDDEVRLQLMNRLQWFLPYFLMLSTSSPFWRGYDTGLSSFRVTVFDSVPRTGLPPHFSELQDYERYVQRLVDATDIQDASEIWWDLRLSCRFPTLELRITDVCTKLDDTISIAAFYLSLVHYLYRHIDEPFIDDEVTRAVIAENRWRASRFNIQDASVISRREETQIASQTLFAEMLDRLSVDAKLLGCEAELMGILDIVRRGTSANQQRYVYQQALKAGRDRRGALEEVVDDLIEQTCSF